MPVFRDVEFVGVRRMPLILAATFTAERYTEFEG
jgi:hypothetical protein